MRVLITGASGFIGSEIVKQLLSREHQILALSRTPEAGTCKAGIHWVKSDLADPFSYQSEVESFQPDVLIHLGWQDIPDFSFEKSKLNLTISLDLLSFLIGIGSLKKFIISGSCFELNRENGECMESEIGTPMDNFTWAKHVIRSWLEMSSVEHKIAIGWLRIFYVYGPGQRSTSLIPRILNDFKADLLPQLKTPKNANDFVFIEDVAKAFLNAIDREFPTGIYNVGSGQSTTVLDVCRIAERIVRGTDILTNELESRSSSTSATANFWANTSDSKRFLAWAHETPLSEGILRTWQGISRS